MKSANEHQLYQHRPDLWAVTKIMKHAKDKYPEIRKLAWETLTDEDKEILRKVANGSMEW